MNNLSLEFSNEFDVLYDSITSYQCPGLTSYEKSVLLTKAQEEVVRSYFDPKSNRLQEGFDGSEKRQIDFSMLMETVEYADDTPSPFLDPTFDLYRSGVKSVVIEDNIMMIVNEYIICDKEGTDVRLSVVPITYTDYSKMLKRPFKRPKRYQAWRLITGKVTKNEKPHIKVDLICGADEAPIKYVLRYVRRPKPIILEDLSGATINGVRGESECELDPTLYRVIIQRAVEIAKSIYTGDLQSQITLGQVSQTEVGTPQIKG